MQAMMDPQIPAILYLVDIERDSRQQGARGASFMHASHMRQRLKPSSENFPEFFPIVLALAPFPVLVGRYMKRFRDSAQAIVEKMSQEDADWKEKKDIGFMHLLQAAISDQPLPIDDLLRYCQSSQSLELSQS